MKTISDLILRLLGWSIESHYRFDLPKIIVAAAPHTSNWDFFLGLLVKYSLNFHPRFIGKGSLFFWPLSVILKKMGGIPVDRSKNNKLVDQVAQLFKENEKIALALAPEGTRKHVDKFKTGFYYIAKAAQVPIILISFDFANKKVIIREPFYPGEDDKKDIEMITRSFDNILGKIPEYSIGFKPNEKKL